MPRVHTRKANKDYPEIGVKKGETYYKWSTRTSRFGKGEVHRSKTYPKPQQLTSSAFLQTVYDVQDALSGIADWDRERPFSENLDEVKGVIEQAVSDIETLRDETQDKFDNMPEGLQQGPTGQMLEGRVQSLDDWINELQGVDEPDAEADDRDDQGEEFVQNVRDQQYQGE